MNEIKDQEVCVQRIFLLLNDDVHDSTRGARTYTSMQ